MKQIERNDPELYDPYEDMSQEEYEAMMEREDQRQGAFDEYLDNQRKQCCYGNKNS